jgi:N-sulfoglucosamine sulfohydrolase
MRSTSLLLATILLACRGPAFAAEPARPSIVVFLADDLGWAECSPYGGREIPTPNMARVAADGMTFTHAFVASPSCAPSRAALLTGLDPMRNGAMLNHARPRDGVKTWPAYFRDLGYEVVSFGKTAHYAQVTGYGFDHASHYKYHEDDCVEAAVGWLSRRESDRPLCLLVGTNWPHVPWPRAGERSARTLPPNLVDTPATRRAWARYAAAVARADRDLGMVYDAARERLGPDALFVFSGDHGAQFPFGKWNGYDAGIRTPLIVAWPGRVAPGSRSDALVSWIDLLPTCLEAAGGEPPAGISGRSFLDVALGKRADHRDAVFVTHSGDGEMNRYPLRAVRDRRWKYIRNLDPDAEHHTHIDRANPADGRSYWDSWVEAAAADPAARAAVDRYLRRPAEELYDLDADPWELSNLAADPSRAEILAKLRADLDAWMKAQGDEGPATERALPAP